jgi:hypothetical protein
MSGAGYAYTTLSAHPGDAVRVGVSLYLDDRAWMCVTGAENGRPRLTVSLGDVSVCFGPVPDRATAEDARTARRLAEVAAEYAAEVERLSAAEPVTPESGASTEAAGSPAA